MGLVEIFVLLTDEPMLLIKSLLRFKFFKLNWFCLACWANFGWVFFSFVDLVVERGSITGGGCGSIGVLGLFEVADADDVGFLVNNAAICLGNIFWMEF